MKSIILSKIASEDAVLDCIAEKVERSIIKDINNLDYTEYEVEKGMVTHKKTQSKFRVNILGEEIRLVKTRRNSAMSIEYNIDNDLSIVSIIGRCVDDKVYYNERLILKFVKTILKNMELINKMKEQGLSL